MMCKVCDFGMSFITGGAAAVSHGSGFGAVVAPGAAVGKLVATVQWAAPELLRDDLGISSATAPFSYELLGGGEGNGGDALGSGSGADALAATCVGSADSWAFGVILWELATLDVPFGQYTALQAAVAVAHRDERLAMPPPEAVPSTEPVEARAPVGESDADVAGASAAPTPVVAPLSCAWPPEAYARYRALASKCLAEDPARRPRFAKAREELEAIMCSY
jgi:serine/threonine protein kinase